MRAVRTLLGSLACSAALLSWHTAPARSQALVDVCSGLSVDLPVLDPVSTATSGLLAGLLDPVLNLIIGEINTDIQVPLSGQNLGLSILDTNGNAPTRSSWGPRPTLTPCRASHPMPAAPPSPVRPRS